MKRWLVFGLLAIIAGILLLELIQRDAGYVLISVLGTTIETSFWFAILVLLVGIVILVVLLLGFRALWRMVTNGRSWVRGRRAYNIEQHYREGLLNVLTGNWLAAEKQLKAVSKRNELPVVRAIAAAQALIKLNRSDQAIALLIEAEKQFPSDRVWIVKARLRLYIENRDANLAESCLIELKNYAPTDPQLSSLELDVRMLNEEWVEAAALLPKTKRGASVSDDPAVLQFSRAFTALSQTENIDITTVDELWEKIPKKLKAEPALISGHVKLLISGGRDAQAHTIICRTLDKIWVPELADCFAKISSSDAQKQLVKAEHWLQKYGEKNELLLTLGVLSIKAQLWGKARSYLEKSVKQQESSHALYLLGLIAETLDEQDLANGYYKKAAGISRVNDTINVV